MTDDELSKMEAEIGDGWCGAINRANADKVKLLAEVRRLQMELKDADEAIAIAHKYMERRLLKL